MTSTPLLRVSIATCLAAALTQTAPSAQTRPPLAIDTARVTLSGTSNIHEYTASTASVRVVRVKVAPSVSPAAFWDDVVKPGALEAFEIAIPSATLTSGKDGLDKNMHKALRVKEHADIVFRLTRLEPGQAGPLNAVGVLRIAGVEREIVLLLKIERRGPSLVVRGELPLLMTDYGIKPPTALLGALKTDPKVTIAFETVLTVPLT